MEEIFLTTDACMVHLSLYNTVSAYANEYLKNIYIYYNELPKLIIVMSVFILFVIIIIHYQNIMFHFMLCNNKADSDGCYNLKLAFQVVMSLV